MCMAQMAFIVCISYFLNVLYVLTVLHMDSRDEVDEVMHSKLGLVSSIYSYFREETDMHNLCKNLALVPKYTFRIKSMESVYK